MSPRAPWRSPRLRSVLRVARKLTLVLGCVVFVPVLFALVGVGVECGIGRAPSQSTGVAGGPAPAERTRATEGLAGYARGEDQTYLTLPEWYIVYSADEYAAFTAEQSPSRFPYFQAVGQYWESYYDVCAVTRARYPFNTGYHLSLVVIGSSFTVENILRGLYENTFGRLSSWLAFGRVTEEDVYAQQVAAEYGAFIHEIPWYEFPFGARLAGLWRETPLWGRGIIRKWERKIALSVEYGAKAGYGWLIGLGTSGVYSAEDLEIQVWAEGLSEQLLREESEVEIVRVIDDQAAIASLPRYEAFTRLVPRLAARGVRFIEIAGNDQILVTAFAPRDWNRDLEEGRLLFEMPILTRPDRKRVALEVPVGSLHRLLNNLAGQELELEHVYDY